ncbi:MAG: RDD family protein [Candidatus Fimimonas sp.]
MIYDIQNASILKRISAFLLDFILMCILAVGFTYILSLATNLEGYSNQLKEIYDRYEAEYGVNFEEMTADKYEKLTDAERAKFDEAYDALSKELSETKATSMFYSLALVCLSVGLLLSFLILEFMLPLLLKNGQTVGMKVFGLGVVFTNSVRVNTFAMFVRSILGKFTLETMVPLLVLLMLLFNVLGIVSLVVLLALVILQIALFATTKTRSFIHDVISNTVIVDINCQMIFDNYDELVSYKEQLAQEEAEKSKY